MKRSITPVNQHWVPQFYLRSFAIPETANDKNPQVWAFGTAEGTGSPFRVAVRNVCAHRHLYSPLDKSGRRDQAMEARLGRLESLATRIWPDLTTRMPDLAHPGLRQCIALVVATMHLRHPRTREVVDQEHAQALCLAEGRGDSTAEIDYLRAMSNNDKDWLFVISIQHNAARIASELASKRWSIVVAASPQFLTSDAPVHPMSPSGLTTGPLSPGALITFPLSPTRILMMDDQHQEPANQYYRAREDMAAATTLSQMRNSARFIFSSLPIDPSLAQMVRTFPPRG